MHRRLADLSHVAFDAGLLDAVAAAILPGRRLQVGAEEPARTDRVLDLVVGAAARGRPVEAALQANLPRSAADAERLAAAGVPVRLVKGAYAEPVRSPRRAHRRRVRVALPPPPRPRRGPRSSPPTTARCATRLLPDLPGARCELLLGVCPDDAVALAAAGRDTRVYVPDGPGWFRYLMRLRAEAAGA